MRPSIVLQFSEFNKRQDICRLARKNVDIQDRLGGKADCFEIRRPQIFPTNNELKQDLSLALLSNEKTYKETRRQEQSKHQMSVLTKNAAATERLYRGDRGRTQESPRKKSIDPRFNYDIIE